MKNILEKYDYSSDYKIDNYTFNEAADDFTFNTLESSIDLIFTPYNANYIGGPYLRVNEEILDNPALDLTKINLLDKDKKIASFEKYRKKTNEIIKFSIVINSCL